jgi:hypothetical protein
MSDRIPPDPMGVFLVLAGFGIFWLSVGFLLGLWLG